MHLVEFVLFSPNPIYLPASPSQTKKYKNQSRRIIELIKMGFFDGNRLDSSIIYWADLELCRAGDKQ